MRALLFLMLYAVAFSLGFVMRGRYDTWMYRKTHMQQRLRVFAAQVFKDPDPVGVTDYLPPPTTDNLALSPSATEAWLQQAAEFAPEDGYGPDAELPEGEIAGEQGPELPDPAEDEGLDPDAAPAEPAPGPPSR